MAKTTSIGERAARGREAVATEEAPSEGDESAPNFAGTADAASDTRGNEPGREMDCAGGDCGVPSSSLVAASVVVISATGRSGDEGGSEDSSTEMKLALRPKAGASDARIDHAGRIVDKRGEPVAEVSRDSARRDSAGEDGGEAGGVGVWEIVSFRGGGGESSGSSGSGHSSSSRDLESVMRGT